MSTMLSFQYYCKLALLKPLALSTLVIRYFLFLAIFSSAAYCIPTAADRSVSYLDEIKPIFDKKCISCHACYDAPCQLKLTSAEGLAQGSSKLRIGSGKSFQSVLRNELDTTSTTLQASLLHQMISLRHRHPFEINQKLPKHLDPALQRQTICPTIDEFEKYAQERPSAGMPFAVTGLSDKEYRTLNKWILEGANIKSDQVQLTKFETQSVLDWEGFLNGSSAKELLVSRYLYEHLFIAHLFFKDAETNHFFELVRSKTPTGKKINPIATALPNDKPNQPFYYRLRPIHSTIVHKAHITYPLSTDKLNHLKTVFLSDDWQATENSPAYRKSASNPFITFSEIPAKARYQFMLDNAEYFIRTFIRGPACRGQIATDVIRDNFWVFFQSPEADLFIVDSNYRKTATPLLEIPDQDDDLLSMGTTWIEYKKDRNNYVNQRRNALTNNNPLGPELNDIWDGDGYNTNALLSVFSHHNNASVQKGLIGSVPKTIWVMDYPLLERSYYELVVNFNVFGNDQHRTQTRLYFDLIRQESELNFLRFLPATKRQKLHQEWAQGITKSKLILRYENSDATTPSPISYQQDNVLKEFVDLVLADNRAINSYTDAMNRCENNDCSRQNLSLPFQRADNALSQLTTLTAEDLTAIQFLPDITFIRAFDHNERQTYSLIRNRVHTNIADTSDKNKRLMSEKDTLTIYPGILGSYPNFIFNLSANDIPLFVGRLQQVTTRAEFDEIISTWGVRRTHPDFWTIFHDFSQYLDETNIVESGIFDMNQYQNL